MIENEAWEIILAIAGDISVVCEIYDADQTLIELGCTIMRLPVMKKLAAHVFFGRGSFPDVELKKKAKSTFFNKVLLKYGSFP